MTAAIDKLNATLGPEALTTMLMEWAPSMVAFVLTIAVFMALHAVLKRVLQRVFERTKLERTIAAFIMTMMQLGISVVGTVTALGQLGIDMSSVLASLGVMGLTIGFAAQNTLSNIVSGIFIFWDRPFVIGDLIEVDGEYGRVETITLRSTRLVTSDGRMVAMPNAVIANAKVRSYTNFPNLRLDVDVTIGVEEPVGRVREILLGLCTGEQFMSTPAPQVVVTELGDYFVGIQLRAWIHDETKHIPERFALRERMKDALDAAKVHMPYETLQLAPFDVRTKNSAAS